MGVTAPPSSQLQGLRFRMCRVHMSRAEVGEFMGEVCGPDSKQVKRRSGR